MSGIRSLRETTANAEGWHAALREEEHRLVQEVDTPAQAT